MEGSKRATMRGESPPGARVAHEPCAACGEETAVGSQFFSDRRVVRGADGPPTYLCVLCDARIRASRRRRQLTDEEVRILVQSGALLDLAWKRF